MAVDDGHTLDGRASDGRRWWPYTMVVDVLHAILVDPPSGAGDISVLRDFVER